MSEFKKYKRKSVSEMRPVNLETDKVEGNPRRIVTPEGNVSISLPDIENGSPKEGDMIARNPTNYNDMWLVAKQYFIDNLEPI